MSKVSTLTTTDTGEVLVVMAQLPSNSYHASDDMLDAVVTAEPGALVKEGDGSWSRTDLPMTAPGEGRRPDSAAVGPTGRIVTVAEVDEWSSGERVRRYVASSAQGTDATSWSSATLTLPNPPYTYTQEEAATGRFTGVTYHPSVGFLFSCTEYSTNSGITFRSTDGIEWTQHASGKAWTVDPSPTQAPSVGSWYWNLHSSWWHNGPATIRRVQAFDRVNDSLTVGAIHTYNATTNTWASMPIAPPFVTTSDGSVQLVVSGSVNVRGTSDTNENILIASTPEGAAVTVDGSTWTNIGWNLTEGATTYTAHSIVDVAVTKRLDAPSKQCVWILRTLGSPTPTVAQLWRVEHNGTTFTATKTTTFVGNVPTALNPFINGQIVITRNGSQLVSSDGVTFNASPLLAFGATATQIELLDNDTRAIVAHSNHGYTYAVSQRTIRMVDATASKVAVDTNTSTPSEEWTGEPGRESFFGNGHKVLPRGSSWSNTWYSNGHHVGITTNGTVGIVRLLRQYKSECYTFDETQFCTVHPTADQVPMSGLAYHTPEETVVFNHDRATITTPGGVRSFSSIAYNIESDLPVSFVSYVDTSASNIRVRSTSGVSYERDKAGYHGWHTTSPTVGAWLFAQATNGVWLSLEMTPASSYGENVRSVGTFASTDEGQTWTEARVDGLAYVGWDPTYERFVGIRYAESFSKYYPVLSGDGVVWTDGAALSSFTGETPQREGRRIKVGPEGTLYFAGRNHLYLSTDGGAIWTQYNMPSPTAWDATAAVAYVSSANKWVVVTEYGATAWIHVSSDLVSWTTTEISTNGNGPTLIADGENVIVTTPYYTRVSSDGCQTWTEGVTPSSDPEYNLGDTTYGIDYAAIGVYEGAYANTAHTAYFAISPHITSDRKDSQPTYIASTTTGLDWDITPVRQGMHDVSCASSSYTLGGALAWSEDGVALVIHDTYVWRRSPYAKSMISPDPVWNVTGPVARDLPSPKSNVTTFDGLVWYTTGGAVYSTPSMFDAEWTVRASIHQLSPESNLVPGTTTPKYYVDSFIGTFEKGGILHAATAYGYIFALQSDGSWIPAGTQALSPSPPNSPPSFGGVVVTVSGEVYLYGSTIRSSTDLDEWRTRTYVLTAESNSKWVDVDVTPIDPENIALIIGGPHPDVPFSVGAPVLSAVYEPASNTIHFLTVVTTNEGGEEGEGGGDY